MITLIIIIVILTVLLGLTIYIIKNLFKQISLLEKLAGKHSMYLLKCKKVVDITSNKLNEIDLKGSFASDDEIGWFFNYIKGLQEILNEYMSQNIKEEENAN